MCEENKMSDLHIYLKETGQRLQDFAAKVGISQAYMSEIASGKKVPSIIIARDVSLLTFGAVPLTYWISPLAKQEPQTQKGT